MYFQEIYSGNRLCKYIYINSDLISAICKNKSDFNEKGIAYTSFSSSVTANPCCLEYSRNFFSTGTIRGCES